MKSATQLRVVVVKSRGRPRLGNYRLECLLPREVLDKLVQVEAATNVYRTRVAANVWCEWAGTKAPDYHHLST
jgi:hypothetical protein